MHAWPFRIKSNNKADSLAIRASVVDDGAVAHTDILNARGTGWNELVGRQPDSTSMA